MFKIALTSDAFIPIIDGVGRVVYEYASRLSQSGNECYVITPMNDTGYRANYPFEIVDFQSMVLPGAAKYRTGIASLDTHYIKRISNVKLDLIHTHSPGPAGMEAIRLANKLRIPLIGTFHSKFYDDFLRATRSEGLATIGVKYVADFFDRCDEVWTVSKFASRLLRDYGYKGPIEIMPNGVDTNAGQLLPGLSADLAKRTYALRDTNILLYAGQLDWKKNIRNILLAASLLHEAGHDFLMVFAGQGQDEGEIKSFAHSLLPDEKLCFTGHVTDYALLFSLYQCADLFVFPSEYDTAGLVVSEAAVAGTPSIVVKNSAPSEVIKDGVNGFISHNNPESLKCTIERALSDTNLLKIISEEAKRSIPLSWEPIMKRVEARYTELVNGKKKSLKRKRGLFRKEITAIDQTLEKRTLDMAWRFLKQDYQHIYNYDYTPQKACKAPKSGEPLPRSTPEQQGVRGISVLQLYREIDRDLDAAAQGMMVVRNGHVIAEGCWAPHRKELPHQLYSMSKSITAIAVGLLVDENKLNIHERIVDIFPDKVEDKARHALRDVTVFHLLTMSSGIRFNEVSTALGIDWVQEFFDGGTLFEPGTQFFYNSMNTYLLAAIVHRKAGCSMMEYLGPRLFGPLRIFNASWETCPMGIEKGGWGLALALEDVAKIGIMMLQKGKYLVDGIYRQILSQQWIEAATKAQIETPNGECKHGYGYQIWIAPYEGAYLFNGAFGQYMLILPDKNALIVLFSGSSRLFSQGSFMEYTQNCFIDASDKPLPEEAKSQRVLQSALSMLSILRRERYVALECMPMDIQWLKEHIADTTYSFPPNVAGMFPMTLQCVHNNFSAGIRRVSFKMGSDNLLYLIIKEGEEENTLAVVPEGFSRGTISLRNETHEVGTHAYYGILPDGEELLQLFVYFLETPFARILTFKFHFGGVTLICDEDPSIQNSAAMLMDLTGITQIELIRSVMPLLKRDKMQNRIRTFTTYAVDGIQEAYAEKESL